MEVALERLSEVVVNVSEPTHAGEARRAAARYAEDLGMKESERGRVAIAVTEMATNIIKHATAGKIILERSRRNGTGVLRVLSIDKGPGIRDMEAAFRDGYSTAGSPGSGLGAVRRAATTFDIFSAPERGTCVFAEFRYEAKSLNSPNAVVIGAVTVPVDGETVCGDAWAMKRTADHVLLMLVDGLGHGIFASEAAREAQRVLVETTSCAPAVILQECHDALRKTRGAGAAVAAINPERETLCFAGLGNISATLTQPQRQRGIASHNGTVGHQMHRIQEFAFPWTRDSVLVMHSDGVSAKWNLADYPGIWNRHPSIIAALLYRDFGRARDDASVLVAKNFE